MECIQTAEFKKKKIQNKINGERAMHIIFIPKNKHYVHRLDKKNKQNRYTAHINTAINTLALF